MHVVYPRGSKSRAYCALKAYQLHAMDVDRAKVASSLVDYKEGDSTDSEDEYIVPSKRARIAPRGKGAFILNNAH